MCPTTLVHPPPQQSRRVSIADFLLMQSHRTARKSVLCLRLQRLCMHSLGFACIRVIGARVYAFVYQLRRCEASSSLRTNWIAKIGDDSCSHRVEEGAIRHHRPRERKGDVEAVSSLSRDEMDVVVKNVLPSVRPRVDDDVEIVLTV
jgi:hypothetical protein